MDFRNYLRMILLQNDGVMAKLGSENIDKNDLVFTRPLRAAFLNWGPLDPQGLKAALHLSQS